MSDFKDNTNLSSLSLHLDGDNSFDASLFIEMIQGAQELFDLTAKEICPESNVKLYVSAPKEGSFNIDFAAVYAFIDTLINNSQNIMTFASTAITTIINLINLRKHLKGQAPKDIKEQFDSLEVINQEGSSGQFNINCKQLINNGEINVAINKFICPMKQRNPNGGMSLSSRETSVYYSSYDIEDIIKPMPYTEIISSQHCTTVVANILIKTAVLIGKGKWSFIYNNHTIVPEIMDTRFFEDIQRNERPIKAGDTIRVKMQICTDIDSLNQPIEKTTKYTILEVLDSSANSSPQLTFD
ncbi:MAG: hypothetical protein DBY09_05015 [Selenomonadales bacterium]|jgi:hypothetical protein|nr:hypothetical protein [Clostridiales bacterium]PWL98878.1 MAG: hypothetical protein DBY09_05015 [Selenomonadales bacterium]DAU21658.1 MAG TPA: hypothetical protein [Caudoviricetes sp.]